MPPVVKITDQNNLVSADQFPDYHKFPYPQFNPVQSRAFEVYDQDANIVVATRTASGKTVISEMYMSHEIHKRGGKALYLVPMRSLAQEKLDDWTDPKHPFSQIKISICTGDYRLTDERRKELQKADLIIMTNEMLSARCRHFSSEKNDFLKEIGTVVSDEFHLLTVPGRGDHAEVGLMKFSQIAENLRIVALSATMPNVGEISDWISYSLTKKDTFLLESDYRPCELGIHYETYYDKGRYEEVEENKVGAALLIREDHPDDTFLIFTHTKRTGEMMKRSLERAGYECEFHSGDLDKAKRTKIETGFRSGKLKTLVATSSLAWGNNFPARRVIVTGVHRGLNEVENYDVFQMVGRAGRPGYDDRGDAYILLPQNNTEEWMIKLSHPTPIVSRLLDYVGDEKNPHYKTLAFHIVSEIHNDEITNADDLHTWYERSLAHFQAQDLNDEIVDSTIELLKRCGAIREEDGTYSTTTVGKVASLFYYSPFDVSDLKRNFSALFDNNLYGNDYLVSMALGNVDTIRMGFASKAEKEEMGSYAGKIRKINDKAMDTAIKGGYAYFLLMHGLPTGVFAAMARNLQFDFPRLKAVLNALDSMGSRWGMKGFFDELQSRIAYGVSPEIAHFCKIPDIGKVRAEKLWNAGIKTYDDISNNPARVQKILGMKADKIKEICNEAVKLNLIS